MDFDYTEEQRMLRESLDKYLGDTYTFKDRNRIKASSDGWSREHWKQYADLGLLGLTIAEKHGGYGDSPIETMQVMEAMGGKLTLEPYFSTVVLGAGALTVADDAHAAALLPRVASGELLLALCHAEPDSRFSLTDIESRVTTAGGKRAIDGCKTVVLHGDTADKLLVSVRPADGKPGIELYLIDARAPGVERTVYRLQDGSAAADIVFKGVQISEADRLGAPGKGLEILTRVVERAIAALAAEAVGTMSAALDITVEYLKTRQQFGVAIGSFQALQHKASSMLIATEQVRSMALYATMLVASEDADERARGFAGVKAYVSKTGRETGHQAIQLHGGIGLTDEYPISHYLKRLTSNALLFGDSDHHLVALAAAGGLYNAR